MLRTDDVQSTPGCPPRLPSDFQSAACVPSDEAKSEDVAVTPPKKKCSFGKSVDM